MKEIMTVTTQRYNILHTIYAVLEVTVFTDRTQMMRPGLKLYVYTYEREKIIIVI